MYSPFAEIFAGVWFFAAGAAIGSFLNVVAYRLPRGKTLWGASHCPYCRRRIAPRDNLPIFGWLLLQGRCRSCRLRISPRYPLVELLTACVFLSLAILDIALAADNLPGALEPRYAGFAWNLFDPRASLIGLFAGHACLMTLLGACLLIERDGQRVPSSLVLSLTVVAVAAAVFVPQDLPLPALASRCCGAWIGAAAGSLHAVANRPMPTRKRPRLIGPGRRQAVQAATVWALCGFVLGGYATVSLFVVSSVVGLASHGVHRVLRLPSAQGPLSVLFWSSWAQLLGWGCLAKLPGWPLDRERLGLTLVWVLAAAAAVVIPSWSAASGRKVATG